MILLNFFRFLKWLKFWGKVTFGWFRFLNAMWGWLSFIWALFSKIILLWNFNLLQIINILDHDIMDFILLLVLMLATLSTKRNMGTFQSLRIFFELIFILLFSTLGESRGLGKAYLQTWDINMLVRVMLVISLSRRALTLYFFDQFLLFMHNHVHKNVIIYFLLWLALNCWSGSPLSWTINRHLREFLSVLYNILFLLSTIRRVIARLRIQISSAYVLSITASSKHGI